MSTDERFDETITSWLEQTAPARLPDRVLEATFERTRTGRQQSGWRAALGRMPLARPALALGSAAAVLVAATLALNVAVVPSVGQRPALPAAPGDWQRVVLDTGVEGRVGVLATGPRGLLAAVGDGDGSRLYFSADGRDWTLVPADQHGPIGTNGAALVATDHGFLLVGAEVLASEDGLSWQRIADPTTEPDLGAGTPIAAAAAGPGVVAVGSDNKAWYSTDGIEWTLAAVPPPPDEPSQLERPLDRTKTQGAVEMQGIAVSGHDLIAWGISIWVHDDDSATFVPVLWASTDGVSWTRVDAPQWTYPKVAGGPDGFAVASNDGAVWLSADGRSWERVAEAAFGPSRWPALRDDEGNKVEMHLRSIAAGVAGYIAAGADGVCLLRCASAETVIWTSPDGRSWARLPDDDRFMAPNGAGAGVAVAWGSDFIVGGESDDRPTVWISGPAAASSPEATTQPSDADPTPSPLIDAERIIAQGTLVDFAETGSGTILTTWETCESQFDTDCGHAWRVGTGSRPTAMGAVGGGDAHGEVFAAGDGFVIGPAMGRETASYIAPDGTVTPLSLDCRTATLSSPMAPGRPGLTAGPNFLVDTVAGTICPVWELGDRPLSEVAAADGLLWALVDNDITRGPLTIGRFDGDQWRDHEVSTNSGAWTSLLAAAGPNVVVLQAPPEALAQGLIGLSVSTDAGATWSEVVDPDVLSRDAPFSANRYHLADEWFSGHTSMAFAGSSVLYVADGNGDLWRSTDFTSFDPVEVPDRVSDLKPAGDAVIARLIDSDELVRIAADGTVTTIAVR